MLNEATSEIKQYAAANPRKAFLDSALLATTVRREIVLLDVRVGDNKLLVFGSLKEVKAKFFEDLKIIRNI